MTDSTFVSSMGGASRALPWPVLKHGVQSHECTSFKDMVGKNGNDRAKPRDDWRGYSETPFWARLTLLVACQAFDLNDRIISAIFAPKRVSGSR